MIDFLHKLFARFGIQETIVSNNTTQFSLKDFESFCKIHSTVHLTSPSYHPRSNGMAEKFVDIFERAIKKANRTETINEELQKFLPIHHITPHVNASSEIAPAEFMIARKIHSVFDRLRPTEKMDERKITMINITTQAKKYISRIINLEKQCGKKEPLIKELAKYCTW